MLSVSNLVRVTVNLTPVAAQARSFGHLLIMMDTDGFDPVERYRFYPNLDAVLIDPNLSEQVIEAATRYFSQSPKPTGCYVGVWARLGTQAFNIGGILSPSQQNLVNWVSITNGSFTVVIDGTSHNITGLDFSGATNLNGVATVIETALTGLSGGDAGFLWDSLANGFYAYTKTRGLGVKATGTVTLDTNPANADTLTMNGVVYTFKTSATLAADIQIGGSKEGTAANLQLVLAASANSLITVATYATVGNVLTVTYKTKSATGNGYTMTKSSSHITLSGAVLSGGLPPSTVGYLTAVGSGTDISAQLKMTSATARELIAAIDAETPAQATAIMANLTSDWYGLMFTDQSTDNGCIPDDDSIDVSDLVEGLEISRLYGITITDPDAIVASSTTDLAYRMKANGYNKSFCQYSSTGEEFSYAVASVFGRMFSVNFAQQNSTITLMYKQEPGITPENIDATAALALKNKNCNVFVRYDNDTALLQYGVVSSGQYLDTIQGADWLQNAIQTACFNVLYTSTTKVPQTNAGVNQLTNAIAGVCGQAVNNGYAAPGVWNGPAFGDLQQGQYLKQGYYIFAESVDNQSESDRQSRIAPPIQVALKLAGAIQTVDVLVDVNS